MLRGLPVSSASAVTLESCCIMTRIKKEEVVQWWNVIWKGLVKRVSQHVERYLAALRERCGVNLAQKPQGKENSSSI